MARELTPCAVAERSLIKTYRKTLWNPFIAAIKRYELIVPGDKIAVCISGGKDSIVLAKLMQELQRHTDHPFELVFLVMDPGYNPANRALIEEALRTAHREDLIGFDKKCLIRPARVQQPKKAEEPESKSAAPMAKNANGNQKNGGA